MKQKAKKKEFRHSLRGYKKEDVNRYILSMDKTAKEDMLECRRNFENQMSAWDTEKTELLNKVAQLNTELSALQEENAQLKKANAESVRKQEEQFVAFAQLVADVTELRKKLAAYEDGKAVPQPIFEAKAAEAATQAQKTVSAAETTVHVPKAEVALKQKISAPIRFSYSVGKNTAAFPFKKNKN